MACFPLLKRRQTAVWTGTDGQTDGTMKVAHPNHNLAPPNSENLLKNTILKQISGLDFMVFCHIQDTCKHRVMWGFFSFLIVNQSRIQDVQLQNR